MENCISKQMTGFDKQRGTVTYTVCQMSVLSRARLCITEQCVLVNPTYEKRKKEMSGAGCIEDSTTLDEERRATLFFGVSQLYFFH